MKFLKKSALACACVLAVALSAGCKMPTYYVYTNIPQDDYELQDNSFKLGGEISGCTVTKPIAEDKDTSNYISWQLKTPYDFMSAYVDVVVAADFSTEQAVETRTAFFNRVVEKLKEIDKALSITVTNSDVNKFNNAAAGQTIEIGNVAYEVLLIAQSVYERTEGYYNPALYYNVQAYGFGDSGNIPQTREELPSDEAVQKYTSLASYFGEVQLSAEGDKYFVTKPAHTVEVDGETLSMKLDLGGIGKGYAVDCVDELFDDFGYAYGYFNFGSSSMLVKRNVQDDVFNMYFSSPRSFSRDPYIKTSARNQKISTSGDDTRKYFIDGVRYCHIIDPTTGKPIQTGIMSASIIGGSAAEDDALTTAIMAMGKDKAISFIESELNDRKVMFTAE